MFRTKGIFSVVKRGFYDIDKEFSTSKVKSSDTRTLSKK